MAKGLFITGTGTDVGKTYVTARIVKKLHDAGVRSAYYKAAISGADSIDESDAGYVRRVAGIAQPKTTLLSYLYHEPLSPHLAARRAGELPVKAKIEADFKRAAEKADYITVEGSGGIICPLCFEADQQILLEDVIQWFKLPAIIVADAGLGTINHTVLTAAYMQSKGIDVRGIILNQYTGSMMERDNWQMMERLTHIPVIAAVTKDADEIEMDTARLFALYESVNVN